MDCVMQNAWVFIQNVCLKAVEGVTKQHWRYDGGSIMAHL